MTTSVAKPHERRPGRRPGGREAAIRAPLPLAVLFVALPLCACAGYRPGTDGTRPTLLQNLPANAQPQPAGSLPR